MGLQHTRAAQLNATAALWEGWGDTDVACAWKICREIHLCCVNLFHCGVLTLLMNRGFMIHVACVICQVCLIFA